MELKKKAHQRRKALEANAGKCEKLELKFFKRESEGDSTDPGKLAVQR